MLVYRTRIDKMRGPPGSTAVLTIVRNGQDRPIEVAVVREPIRLRSLLRKAEGGGLFAEAIGGKRVFDFERARPTPIIPLSDTEFCADGRFNTGISFTTDPAGKASGAVLNPGRWEQKGMNTD